MVAAETSPKPRPMAEKSAPSDAKAEDSVLGLGTCAHLPVLRILCGITDEVQDYQLRIQQNTTCITSYAPLYLSSMENRYRTSIGSVKNNPGLH